MISISISNQEREKKKDMANFNLVHSHFQHVPFPLSCFGFLLPSLFLSLIHQKDKMKKMRSSIINVVVNLASLLFPLWLSF